MMHRLLSLFFVALGFCCSAQEFKVEFDPKTDFTRYQTFRFGEGEIITPHELRTVADSTLHQWIKSSLRDELTRKGLRESGGGADMVISYITGSQRRKESEKNGPFGLTPGSNPEQTFEHDFRVITLVIDLNDPKTNQLIWRVNSVLNSNKSESEEYFGQIVMKGFRKFSNKPHREKRKK